MIAFVIPLDATRHMKYAQGLAALVSPVSDVYVILTNEKDRATWNSGGSHEGVRPLVLTDYVSEDAITTAIKNRSMPTFKKWMGMDIVLQEFDGDQYKYFITCDCEVKVVKPLDAAFVEALPSQFNFIGDHMADKKSWQSLVESGNSWDRPQEDDGPCDRDIYAWWSGLPLYDVSSLPEFLEHVGTHNHLKLASSLRWEMFDHMVYQRWVFSRGLHQSRFVCLTHELRLPLGWSLEYHLTPPPEVWDAAKRAGLIILWASLHTYKTHPKSVEGVYLIYHLDRSHASRTR